MFASHRSTEPTLARGSRARAKRSRSITPLPEHLEGRQLLTGSRLPTPASQAAAIVDQTYRTLVGQAPTPAQTGTLVRVQAKAGNYGVTAAIVGSRPFFEQMAGGDPHRYVSLAAATLDVYPNQVTVDRLAAQVEARDASAHILRAVVTRLTPPGSFSPPPQGPTNPLYRSLLQDVLINADYWESTPKILGAGLGFTHIIGVPGLNGSQPEVTSRKAGGPWETLSSPSASTAALRAYTSAISPNGVASGYGYPVLLKDGFPVEFSWPIQPSTLSADDFRITLNTGQVVQPDVASILPNEEYNERSTVVLFGDFGNRITPGDPGSIYPVRFDVVPSAKPLQLVGPGGEIRSAVGLSFGDGATPMSAYVPNSGPKLVAAKLSVLSTAGESAPATFSGQLPNDGVTLYGDQAQYRLRVMTTGGFSPDGVRSVYPTDFSRFFRLQATDSHGQVRYLTETGVDYQLPSGTVRILGLADLGPSQSSYDDSYVEDHDNQIDIILSGDRAAISTITAVEIPASGSYSPFFNPGGPGNAPTPGIPYSQPGPSLVQPVTLALDDPMTVTFVSPTAPRRLAQLSRNQNGS
ncbi:hypothetical protein [Singulisphaera acidiphila]|uniref:Uncharacterized protein n=1 Tax=Singulisphaera acidiphila (strain ATCC BAA-1392 / DSM 18658 / VKM B-2454 / MOB10) TaxID=886293 RepID=L0DHG7_SINAD|nr:hypothetical protein [Singulisphaera acidiphila]AGA28809.1 hypothetical protein Sinac_4632 [Singulisphaera acidiphila DSM 18658]